MFFEKKVYKKFGRSKKKQYLCNRIKRNASCKGIEMRQ